MKLLVTSILLAILCIQENKAQDTLNYFDHYYEGLSKSDEKPICLIFTGISCKNNFRIKKELSDDEFIEQLNKSFNTIILDIDSYKKISPDDKEDFMLSSSYKYYGQWWMSIMLNDFNNRIAPAAIIIDKEGTPLSDIYHYSINKTFYQWVLDKKSSLGLDDYKQRNPSH